MTWSNAFVAWRQKANLSQAAIAAHLGVHEQTVQNWERSGRATPPRSHAWSVRVAPIIRRMLAAEPPEIEAALGKTLLGETEGAA